MADSPSPYAPGIIGDEPASPRPAGRAVVFLVATFVTTAIASGTVLFGRAARTEAAGGPTRMNLLVAAATVPRALMLLWAFLSDRVPLWGTRREGYLLFTALLTALAWVVTAFAGDRQSSWLIVAALFGTVSAVSHAATSGGLAEIGQRRRATGRLSAAFIGMAQLGVIASFALSTASELVSPWMTAGVAIGLSLAVVLLIITLGDDTAAPPAPTVRPSIPRFLRQLHWRRRDLLPLLPPDQIRRALADDAGREGARPPRVPCGGRLFRRGMGAGGVSRPGGRQRSAVGCADGPGSARGAAGP